MSCSCALPIFDRRLSVRQNGRNIASHTGLLVIYFHLVDWTCSRVLVQSTGNLFRSTVYELKLCTSYFWSISIRPSVRQNGRNIAYHTGLGVIFYNLVDWTCPRVLVQSTWNLFRSTVYKLKLCTSYFWSTSIRPSVRPEHSPPQHFNDLSGHFFLSFLSWTRLKIKSVTSRSHQGHVKVMSRARWGNDMK